MVEQNVGVQELNTSKERLRDALTLLETVVDKRLELALSHVGENDSVVATQLAETQHALENKERELEDIQQNMSTDNKEAAYLRDENQKLQSEAGHMTEETKQLKKHNKRVVVRVDSLIAELEAVLQEQGA